MYTQIYSLIILVLLTACSSPSQKASKTTPTTDHPFSHLIIMVFDAMRPDLIDRFNLKNFKKLRSQSQNYKNAYLGYLGAVTSVSHLVLPTGERPKNLPWQDDVYWDTRGLLGTPDQFYTTAALTAEQLQKLMSVLPKNETLPGRVREELGGKAFAVGGKNFATLMLGTPYSDGIITLKKENGRCLPDGIQVPEYIKKNDRYTLECAKTYGTEDTFYPLDGSRFVPGDDPTHLGGDTWVADVAIDLMKNENWSGLFLTFNGIDKIIHTRGEPDLFLSSDPQVETQPPANHLKAIALNADEQLGKILSELQNQNLLQDTLIVVTADHGCQTDRHFLGNGKTSKWGKLANEPTKETSDWVKHFAQLNDVRFSLQDTAIRLWLKTRKSKRTPVIQAMSEVPGVTQIFELIEKQGEWSYRAVFSNLMRQSDRFRKWAENHSKELVDAVATPNSPDLIALLADHTGFDLLGDHGGAQEKVQRIPLMILNPKIPPKTISLPFRLYELKQELFRDLHL